MEVDMPYEFDVTQNKAQAVIKVFGVGGGGNNAVNRMIDSGLQGVNFYAINTDSQTLAVSLAENKIQIGVNTTKGLGAGANPEQGEKSAEENAEELKKALEGADLVFITAGMGGGTGTGASHVIAKLAKEMNILVIGVVTRPFHFEGKVRKINSDLGIRLLKDYVDALVVIPNDRLLQVANTNTTFKDSFRMADEVLLMGVKGITDLISTPGLINLDFADVKTIIQNAGLAHMGMGVGTGADKATDAAKQAIESPLLETSIQGATGVLLNITGGEGLTLFDVEKIATVIREEAHPDANMIFGACTDPDLDDVIKVTVIATGFTGNQETAEKKPQTAPLKPASTGGSGVWPPFLDEEDYISKKK